MIAINIYFQSFQLSPKVIKTSNSTASNCQMLSQTKLPRWFQTAKICQICFASNLKASSSRNFQLKSRSSCEAHEEDWRQTLARKKRDDDLHRWSDWERRLIKYRIRFNAVSARSSISNYKNKLFIWRDENIVQNVNKKLRLVHCWDSLVAMLVLQRQAFVAMNRQRFAIFVKRVLYHLFAKACGHCGHAKIGYKTLLQLTIANRISYVELKFEWSAVKWCCDWKSIGINRKPF